MNVLTREIAMQVIPAKMAQLLELGQVLDMMSVDYAEGKEQKCAACGKTEGSLAKCTGCGTVRYCSKVSANTPNTNINVENTMESGDGRSIEENANDIFTNRSASSKVGVSWSTSPIARV